MAAVFEGLYKLDSVPYLLYCHVHFLCTQIIYFFTTSC